MEITVNKNPCRPVVFATEREERDVRSEIVTAVNKKILSSGMRQHADWWNVTNIMKKLSEQKGETLLP